MTAAGSAPFTTVVRALPGVVPFVGPEAIERRRGQPFSVRVGANESAFGVSPAAAAAMRAEVQRIAWYGDPEGHDLRAAIAAEHGVRMDEVCVAAGIDELLGLTVRLLVEPGTPVLTSLGAYPTFNYHVQGYGGELLRVPYRDDRIDLDALLDTAQRRRPALVYLANPDNPMGTWHDAAAVRAFLDALPAPTVLVLDEAYVEFAPPEVLWPVQTAHPRLLRMRTFSKAHGMAGARVGYALGNAELVGAFDRVRNHFGVSRLALAGARASLQDREFVASVCNEVAVGRGEYEALAASLGLASVPSATNFLAIDVGGGERARAVLAALEARGVFVRMPGVAPLDRCIRVTVGRPDERARFAEALRAVLAES